MQGSESALHDQLAWDDVRLFVALSRSRSLGEAGRRLGLDGSTMSRRLDALEETLGATLFERGRAGIRASEAAERLLPIAEEIEHGIARFGGTAETFEREVAGSVRIASPADVAEVLLTPILAQLFERHPHLRIDIRAGERLVDMARRDADLALRTVRPDRGDLVVRKLLSVRWVLATAPARARALGKVCAFDDLPWIGFSPHMTHTTPGRWLAEHVEVEPLVRSDSLTVQLAAASTGLGVALVPDASLDHYGLQEVRLTPRLRKATAPFPSDDLFLVTHQALRSVPRVRAVWDYLVTQRSGG